VSGNLVSTSPPSNHRALFVDLDGTLIATDLLWEALVRVLKRQPWVALLLPLWILRGPARFKQAVAHHTSLDASTLPYRTNVLDHVRERRAEGDRIILATATPQPWADAIAEHLDLFDGVLASSPSHNLKGTAKLRAIQTYCETHHIDRWDYMGDSSADLAIWAQADRAHVVAPSGSFLRRVQRRYPTAVVHGVKTSVLGPMIRAMRPHQWAKNGLVFAPLVLARRFDDVSLVLAALAAFATFSLCASAVYVLNDLADIEADRAHPRKCRRPFASGALPVALGPGLAFMALAMGLGLAAVALPPAYLGLLVLYIVVTSAYTAILKSKVLVDILVLASLYTLRVFAGGVATGLEVSEWLLAFSIFVFTSLAFAKRYVEMSRLADEGKTTAKGRGYEVGDLSLIESFGTASGYIAVLVFALYLRDGLPSYYTRPWMLWLSCPLLLFWISRLWILAKRGQLDDDPVVFAATDPVSLSIGATIGLLVLFAGPIG